VVAVVIGAAHPCNYVDDTRAQALTIEHLIEGDCQPSNIRLRNKNVNEIEQQGVSQQLVQLLQDQIGAPDFSRMKETNHNFVI